MSAAWTSFLFLPWTGLQCAVQSPMAATTPFILPASFSIPPLCPSTNVWQVVGAGSGPRAGRRQQQLPPNVVVAHLGEPSCFALLRCENLCAYSLLLLCCSVRPDSLAALEHQPCHPLLWLLHQPIPLCPARRPAQSKESRPSTCSAGAPCAACTCPTRVSCGGRQGQLCVQPRRQPGG